LLELDESNLAVLPGDSGSGPEGDDNAPNSVMVATNDGQLVLGYGSTLYCRKGLRADFDLYCNGLDRADFSSETLAGLCSSLVIGFLSQLLATDGEQLAAIPEQSLSLFVSLDCFSGTSLSPCSNCDLESRLSASLQSLISEELMLRHPFYSEGCPYALLKRRVRLD
uniref:RNase III domain-containing protein n=1 Tax=Macrostomum lignano TaxID=282301 RepID=A0A1I8HPH7_9PLAT